jgi:hypothetical protein
MAERSHKCECRQKPRDGKGKALGLDELMIVNPASAAGDTVFLGKDGTLYQVQGLGETEELQGTGQFFLGEDGMLYEVVAE